MPTTTLDAVRAGLSLKIRENRARRALRRQGRLLVKSRTGDPTYMVINQGANVVECRALSSIGELEDWIAA